MIKKKMKKDSCLIGSIPNVRYITNLIKLLVFKDWRYENLGILDKTHLRFFTQKSLIRMFHNNSFYIEKFSGINKAKINTSSCSKLITSSLIFFLSYLIGIDSRYFQFGFRVKLKQSRENNFIK
jgi:hypothetical protein